MTNPTAIAAPAAPQRQIPAGSDRAKKEAAANGPSFASVMQAQRGEANQGRTRGAAPGEADTQATTGTDPSNTETVAPGDAEHPTGLSALRRRDWHEQLKRLTSSEDQPQSSEQFDPAQADMSAQEGQAPALRQKRAANSNAMPAPSSLEQNPESLDEAPRVRSTHGVDRGKPAETNAIAKPEKPKDASEAEQSNTASVDTAPVPPVTGELLPTIADTARKPNAAKDRPDENDVPSDTAPPSRSDDASPPTGKSRSLDPEPVLSATSNDQPMDEPVGLRGSNAPSASSQPSTPASWIEQKGATPQAPAVRAATNPVTGPAAATVATRPSEPTQSASSPIVAAPATATPVAAQAIASAAAQANTDTPSTPPAFTVEMTVAAANYALASGKQPGATDRSPETTVTTAATAEPTSDRPHVTVLPMKAQVGSPGLSAAAALTMPQAFVADDQARQSARMSGAAEEIKTLGADKTADESPRTRVEPETGTAIQSRAPSMQGPAMQQTQASPVATVVAALAADPATRPQPISPLAQVLSPQSASEPKTLTIQLHPAELGIVYATFQMTDGQMSVEISAETDDARSRLSAESHTIAKSLRSLGIDVDQVTVMQTATPVPTVARAEDAAAQNLPSARDQQSSFGAQTSGGGGSRLGGQQNGRSGHDTAGAGRDQPSAADRSDGGVYI
jgi:chemotaxis protein MotD